MVDQQQFIVRHSVEDVLGILQREPVQRDLVLGVTAVQLLNRVSLAHLSIERAIKFLIVHAGGSLVPNHHLGRQYRELAEQDPATGELLEQVFSAAVRHYRYNPNATNMTHLKTLDRYLDTAGSDRAFQDLRYWELTQSPDEVLLGRLYLSIHMELLHGLSQVLLGQDRPIETVADRVERAVQDAMWVPMNIAYSEGTPKERSVRDYMRWRSEFTTWGEALGAAVHERFNIGDEFMRETVSAAYRVLLGASDPAVAYFANTLDILPAQPRDVIPCVEWLDREAERRGSVSTPAGTPLGMIERGPDGIWYITPAREGLVRVSAKASTQTDARCYLAALLTSEALVMVGGGERYLRVVGSAHHFFERSSTTVLLDHERDDQTWTHKLTFWDQDHGIDVGDNVRAEPRSAEEGGLVHILEGRATEVAEHEVYLSGRDIFDVVRSDRA